jgi:hypothetical protein
VIASVFMAVPTSVTAFIKAVTCKGQSDTGVAGFKMLFSSPDIEPLGSWRAN